MSQTNKVHLWVRAETKKNEQRTALTPNNCKSLIDKGFDITVEDSPQSIFKISEYTALKIPTAKAGEWQTKAPKNAFILGLKELPEVAEGDALYELVHRHIMFAHCYKGQDGWKGVLDRFVKGKTGKLFDLEFLTDVTGRRVAAFGYYAGFAGAAVAVDVWCHRILNGNDAPYPSIKPYSNQSDLIEYIKLRLSLAKVKNNNVLPKVFVIGALGRCGKGAVDFSELVGITKKNLIKWDIQETSLKPGPYAELLTTEIFINCIYLSKPIPPFLNTEFLLSNETTRKLNVICDVSCDATNPHNPIPVYWGSTTFDDPLVRVMKESKNPIDVIAIDHLPTLLPRESSEFFGKDLQDSLVALQSYEKGRVWNDAENLFWKKVAESGK